MSLRIKSICPVKNNLKLTMKLFDEKNFALTESRKPSSMIIFVKHSIFKCDFNH